MTEGQPTTCRKLKTYTQIAQALSSYTQKMVWLLVHLQEDSKDVGLCLSAQRLKEVGQLVRSRVRIPVVVVGTWGIMITCVMSSGCVY